MALSAGSRLGPYEITGPIGAGGMGEVYRAHDARLGRDVALKILPEAFALDADRLARFEREARLLASLNHPNIAQIYGIEESAEVRALVMELVSGDDLSEILARGALPLSEALPIARQIAEALEAAHDAGIVHRDLKPANVKVRRDGTVKVLDFGLAKGDGAEPASGAPGGIGSENSPTLLSPAMTQIGVILGTAAYMSPEQARGKAVDRRTDIWAFGAVLFEMLTGERLFTGETVTDVIASVMRRDIDLAELPSGTPDVIRRLLARCLDRDAKRRLQAIGEARLALEEASLDLSLRARIPASSGSITVMDAAGHPEVGRGDDSRAGSGSGSGAGSRDGPSAGPGGPGAGMSTGMGPARTSRASHEADLPDARTAHGASGPRSASAGRRRGRALVAAGIVLTIAAAAIAFTVMRREKSGAAANAPGAARAERSIAVLPFVNSSGNAEDDYLADGMTDELIAGLAKVPRLRVAARSSVFTFKGRKAEVREVAQKLGVDTVLEGTLRRSGKRLRVTASLVSASDGLQIWSSSFENDGGDPFAVQDEVTNGVVSGLSLTLGGTALAASQAGRTKDPEAHDLYLRGLASANPASEADLRRALDLYQQALARDPDFALPYVGIAWVHAFLADAYVAPNEAYPKAKAAARAALERDDLLADAHALLAYSTFGGEWNRGDLSLVEREFRRALDLDPNSANTLAFFANYRWCLGRRDDSLAAIARAERLDPLSPIPPFMREWGDFASGRYRDAIESHRKTAAVDPSFVYIESWVGDAYRELGDYPAALTEYAAAEKLLGGVPQAGLALTYARMGRDADAKEEMRKLDAYAARTYVAPSLRASVHAALGDKEGAIALLQEAFDKSDLYLIVSYRQREIAPLRKDPRTRRIFERLDALTAARP